ETNAAAKKLNATTNRFITLSHGAAGEPRPAGERRTCRGRAVRGRASAHEPQYPRGGRVVGRRAAALFCFTGAILLRREPAPCGHGSSASLAAEARNPAIVAPPGT